MVEKRTGIYGICFQDGKLLCGVAQELDVCDEGTWRPPHVVAVSGYEHRTCAYTATSTKIGRCGPEFDGSLGACSNFASRCDDPDAYVSRDPTCFVTHDGGDDGGDDGSDGGSGEEVRVDTLQIGPFGSKNSASFRRWTTYGKCVPPGMNDHRCVWSPDDCTEGEFYVRNDPECTADKIELGACFKGYAYCTVSKDNCNNPTVPYYTHQDMLDTFDADCYLAALPVIRAPEPPTVAPVTFAPVTFAPVASTSAPVATPATFQRDVDDSIPESQLEIEESLTTDSSAESSTNSGLSMALTIGIAVGCAMVVGMALGLAMSRQQRRNRRKKRRRPVRTVVAEEIIIDDDEELSEGGWSN